jgi:peptidoglycan hydrolase-like protein with peptidoglycan-binding domain
VSEYGKGEWLGRKLMLVFAASIGAAGLLVATASPLAANKNVKEPKKMAEVFSDPDNGEPLTLIVALRDQQLDLYRGLTLIAKSKVSTGTREYPTKVGVFSILEKRRYHHSNMYSAAPMPWMQRLTWSGTALHGGVVPDYPASHGCIRLPFSFAPKLFEITGGGENVIVSAERPVPKIVEHTALFHPSNSNGLLKTRLNNATLALTSNDEGPNGSAQAEGGSTVNNEKKLTVDNARPVAPLRILVTRRTERDRIISVQYLLSSMGYLESQKFSGRLGNATVAAIKNFQKANGLTETGTYTAGLAKKVYEVAGKDEPPTGHLFVRQDFKAVFDTPIPLSNPKYMLGMHVFTALFAPGDRNAQWMVMSLEGDAVAALDRVEIPDDIRARIEDQLTPGSSLIISDESKDSAILPDGGDYIVLARSAPLLAEIPKSKARRAALGKPKAKFTKKLKRGSRAYADVRSFDRPKRSFFRWRWRR